MFFRQTLLSTQQISSKTIIVQVPEYTVAQQVVEIQTVLLNVSENDQQRSEEFKVNVGEVSNETGDSISATARELNGTFTDNSSKQLSQAVFIEAEKMPEAQQDVPKVEDTIELNKTEQIQNIDIQKIEADTSNNLSLDADENLKTPTKKSDETPTIYLNVKQVGADVTRAVRDQETEKETSSLKTETQQTDKLEPASAAIIQVSSEVSAVGKLPGGKLGRNDNTKQQRSTRKRLLFPRKLLAHLKRTTKDRFTGTSASKSEEQKIDTQDMKDVASITSTNKKSLKTSKKKEVGKVSKTHRRRSKLAFSSKLKKILVRTSKSEVQATKRTFYCEVCCLRFTCFRRYWNHKNLLHRSHAFVCLLCDKLFKTTSALLHHTKFRHKELTVESVEEVGDPIFYCEACGLGFRNIQKRVAHIQNEHKNGYICCSLCNHTSSSVEDLVFHSNDHKKFKTTSYSCKVCDKNLYFLPVFINHLYTHNNVSSPKLFHCKVCFVKVRHFSEYVKHVERHLFENNKYFCFICEKYFRSNAKLEWHMKYLHKDQFLSHSGFIRLESLKVSDGKHCYWCGKIVAKERLKRHLRRHTKFLSTLIKKKVTCKVCLKSVATYIYRRHLFKHFSQAYKKQLIKSKQLDINQTQVNINIGASETSKAIQKIDTIDETSVTDESSESNTSQNNPKQSEDKEDEFKKPTLPSPQKPKKTIAKLSTEIENKQTQSANKDKKRTSDLTKLGSTKTSDKNEQQKLLETMRSHEYKNKLEQQKKELKMGLLYFQKQKLEQEKQARDLEIFKADREQQRIQKEQSGHKKEVVFKKPLPRTPPKQSKAIEPKKNEAKLLRELQKQIGKKDEEVNKPSKTKSRFSPLPPIPIQVSTPKAPKQKAKNKQRLRNFSQDFNMDPNQFSDPRFTPPPGIDMTHERFQNNFFQNNPSFGGPMNDSGSMIPPGSMGQAIPMGPIEPMHANQGFNMPMYPQDNPGMFQPQNFPINDAGPMIPPGTMGHVDSMRPVEPAHANQGFDMSMYPQENSGRFPPQNMPINETGPMDHVNQGFNMPMYPQENPGMFQPQQMFGQPQMNEGMMGQEQYFSQYGNQFQPMQGSNDGFMNQGMQFMPSGQFNYGDQTMSGNQQFPQHMGQWSGPQMGQPKNIFKPPMMRTDTVCLGCQKNFRTSKVLLVHELFCLKLVDQLSKQRLHNCPVCLQTFYALASIKQHMFQSHAQIFKEFNLISGKGNQKATKDECKTCNQVFKNKEELAAHEMTHEFLASLKSDLAKVDVNASLIEKAKAASTSATATSNRKSRFDQVTPTPTFSQKTSQDSKSRSSSTIISGDSKYKSKSDPSKSNDLVKQKLKETRNKIEQSEKVKANVQKQLLEDMRSPGYKNKLDQQKKKLKINLLYFQKQRLEQEKQARGLDILKADRELQRIQKELLESQKTSESSSCKTVDLPDKQSQPKDRRRQMERSQRHLKKNSHTDSSSRSREKVRRSVSPRSKGKKSRSRESRDRNSDNLKISANQSRNELVRAPRSASKDPLTRRRSISPEHTSTEKRPYKRHNLKPGEEMGAYQCKKCATLFTNYRDYITHMDSHEDDEDAEENYLTLLDASSPPVVNLTTQSHVSRKTTNIFPDYDERLGTSHQIRRDDYRTGSGDIFAPSPRQSPLVTAYAHLKNRVEYAPSRVVRPKCQVCSQEFPNQEYLDYHACPGPF